MVAVLSPLDVRKGFGLGSVMTHDVSACEGASFRMQLTLMKAMRRVLHLKMVTQCAMLEDFGIFLVLADKVGGNADMVCHH
jgi:hypothetical protein